MSHPVVAELVALLTLERLEDNLFRGQSRDIGTKYVFGGQVLGQALSAAQQTVEDKRAVPTPSKAKRGQHIIELPASLSAKVLLLNEMVAQNMRPAELARRLNTTPQEVNRLTNLRHTTRIDSIADALRAMGRKLEIGVI